MGFALPNPTPTLLEEQLQSLPAEARATLAWVPRDFRRDVVEPLRSANIGTFDDTLDRAARSGATIFLRLAAASASILTQHGDALVGFLDSPASTLVRHRIDARLGAGVAAEQLWEAYEWTRAILVALLRDNRADIAAHDDVSARELTETELDEAVEGPAGAFLRGLVATCAALELLLSDQELPAVMQLLCERANVETQAGANALRGLGLALPIAIHQATPRRWPAWFRRSELPPGVMERVRRELAPEEVWLFGSRARGTHGPWSDWDLLVVVPDTSRWAREPSPLVAELRRRRIDLVLVSRSDFEEGRFVRGSLVDITLREGRRLDV